MEDILYYLLKISIGTAVFYVTYHFLFRKSKQFVFNRLYLAGSFLASFIIPLITFKSTTYLTQVGDYSSGNASGAGVSEYATYASETAKLIGLPEFVLIIYLAGVVYYLVKLVNACRVAACIRKRCTKEHLSGMNVYVSEDNIRAFTFLDKIIIGKNILNHPSLILVLIHESVHSREKHFYDILMSELLCILQWFNPFARFHAEAIRNNLEFRADDIVIRESDIREYQLTMLSMVHNRVKPPLFTGLNSSNLKKRIIMMKSKSQERFASIARLAVIPVFAILLVSLSGKKTVVVQDHQSEYYKLSQTDSQSYAIEENSGDELKSIIDMRRYMAENIRYPREAAESGHTGMMELYARVNHNGAIETILELQPEGEYVDIDEIVIVGYAGAESEMTESPNHKSLISEGRRVIESFPKLKIPGLYGQIMKLKFKFVLQ